MNALFKAGLEASMPGAWDILGMMGINSFLFSGVPQGYIANSDVWGSQAPYKQCTPSAQEVIHISSQKDSGIKLLNLCKMFHLGHIDLHRFMLIHEVSM